MIDIETMSTDERALVMSVGVVSWRTNLTKKPTILATEVFYPSLEQQRAYNRVIDIETVMFWMQQSEKARQGIYTDQNRCSVEFMFNWLRDSITDETKIWSNSPNFDTTILGTLADDAGVPRFGGHWQYRDVRTLLDETHIDKAPLFDLLGVESHDPIGDCKVQITAVEHARAKMAIRV